MEMLRNRRTGLAARWVCVASLLLVCLIAPLWAGPAAVLVDEESLLRLDDGRVRQMEVGEEIASGAFLQVGAKYEVLDKARVVHPRGAFLIIQPGSRFEPTMVGLRLMVGASRIDVRPSGRGFTVNTPCAVLAVRGTKFYVLADTDLTGVSLFEGKLDLETPQQKVVMAPGDKYLARDGQELQTLSWSGDYGKVFPPEETENRPWLKDAGDSLFFGPNGLSHPAVNPFNGEPVSPKDQGNTPDGAEKPSTSSLLEGIEGVGPTKP